MKPKPNSLLKLCCVLVRYQRHVCCQITPRETTTATYSTISRSQVQNVLEEESASSSIDLLRRWGCTHSDITKILARRPALCNADVSQLQSKLTLLQSLGIASADLVKIINRRPKFLSCRIDHYFDERLQYFLALFGSRELLLKAIIRNPSLLIYNFHDTIKPAISLYEDMGLSRNDLITMMLSRPTLIPRTSFNDEKLECIRKTGISRNCKMYKYVVVLIGISRIETIRAKVTNLEKFEISEQEVWSLFGRAPLLLTLSIDKVQRNMTFVVGTMKLPANVVLDHPFLLFNNLEAVLKPRVVLAGRIQEMDLSPEINGHAILRALRMKEKRFLEAFVLCHPQHVAEELMEFYRKAKHVKRLAAASKKKVTKGFPF